MQHKSNKPAAPILACAIVTRVGSKVGAKVGMAVGEAVGTNVVGEDVTGIGVGLGMGRRLGNGDGGRVSTVVVTEEATTLKPSDDVSAEANEDDIPEAQSVPLDASVSDTGPFTVKETFHV
jgi:hypothetical protein